MRWIGSLSTRLLLSSLLLLPLFCIVSGWMLDQAFSRSLLAAEKEKLKSQFYLLLSSVEWQDNAPVLPEQLAEPRFSTINSGLYARITNSAGERLWQSPSSLLLHWPSLSEPAIRSGSEFFSPFSTARGNYFYYRYDIVWVDDNDREIPLRIGLLQDQSTFTVTRNHYRQLLWRWLTALSLILILTLWLLMRWGLQPLRRLASELEDIENGRKPRLSQSYPQEIQPVTRNLNQLLDSERRQQERYRNTLGDLAHSLKTPLTVINGCLRQLPDSTARQQVDDQIHRMDDIIQHQLQRAVKRQISPLISQQTALQPLLQRLLNTLNKVYADKSMRTTLQVDPDLSCRYSEADLLELCGNLLDNSYKYGHQQVQITASRKRGWLWLSFDDDGKGVAKDQRTLILERGARADTATSGQGIGLAVVTDILSSLGGSLEIDQSPLGGASIRIGLPDER